MSEGRRLGPGEPRSAGAIPQRRVPQAWPKDRRFRILSIDGGGIRGIFPAAVLAGLERRFTSGASIANHFDLVAGTSTGGILALGLGAGYTAAELLDLYVTRGCEVFPPFAADPLGRLKAWIRDKKHYARYLYDRAALERMLTDKLGDRLFGDSRLRLCIPAFEGKHSEVFVFKTPHHPDYKTDRFERMIALLCFVLAVLASPFKSKSRLEAENAALRHQLIVLRRKVQGRVRLTNNDRLLFIQLYRWFPSVLKVLTIIRPETIVRWHRAGFRRFWRWKSCSLGGRPQIDTNLRALIRRISIDNPLWGAPRIHGELLKLGFEVAQSSVAKYMVKRRGPPSQGWRTFLRNHAPDIAAMDLFVVPTIGFELLYAFVIVRLDRRNLVWINVTTNPTAEWIARQITEAFPWNEAPQYLIRDRDRVYGTVVTRRLRAMGIRDKPIAPGSPWQNGFAERLIGSIRRECVDHMIVLGEAHLRRILTKYAAYYNELRTHRSLNKDAPIHRAIQHLGRIVSAPVLGGLHHQYVRV